MKKRVPILLTTMLCSICAPACADDASASADNATVNRGLKHVRDAGERWIAKQGCVSCHQVPSMVWAHEAALQSGLRVPTEQLAEWRTWSTEVVNFVKPDQKANCDHEATMASNIDTMVAMLLAIPAEYQGSWRVEFAKKLAREQAADGSWRPCGQLPMQRRSELETQATTTLWTALALAQEEVQFNQQQAFDFADQLTRAESTEWYSVRLLVADQMDSERTMMYQQHLLELQNEDGGWGWKVGEASDALGTGYALYALAKTGADAKKLASARHYLRSTQTTSGKWVVPGTKKSAKGKPTATANDWGTAWAIIALAQSQLAEAVVPE